MKKIIFALLISLNGLNSFALSCKSFLNSEITEVELLNVAARAENAVSNLSSLYTVHPNLSEAISETIYKLGNGMDRILSLDLSKEGHIYFYSRFNLLVSRLESDPKIFLEEVNDSMAKLNAEDPGVKTISWADILDSPKLIEAEKKYSITRVDGSVVKVVFSTKVVNKAINSTDNLIKSGVEKSLKALESLGGATSAGLVRMIANKSVYEIRIIGNNGNFRFFAYQENDVFHVVHWSKNSNHSIMVIAKAIESVMGARFSREGY